MQAAIRPIVAEWGSGRVSVSRLMNLLAHARAPVLPLREVRDHRRDPEEHDREPGEIAGRHGRAPGMDPVTRDPSSRLSGEGCAAAPHADEGIRGANTAWAAS